MPGQGSRFWFSARLARRDAGTGRSRAPAESAEVALRRDHAGRRILVAEDEPVNAEIIDMVLQGIGLEVVQVQDGVAAVEAASAGGFDLVLMDMQMPRLDGVEATRRIRALGTDAARVPIVALTADVNEEDRQAALAAGMDDFVTKPFAPAVVYAALLRCFEARVRSAAA